MRQDVRVMSHTELVEKYNSIIHCKQFLYKKIELCSSKKLRAKMIEDLNELSLTSQTILREMYRRETPAKGTTINITICDDIRRKYEE